jgi:hypothetical protein
VATGGVGTAIGLSAAVADDDDGEEVSPVIKPRRCIKRFFKLSIILSCSFELGNGTSLTGLAFVEGLSFFVFPKLRICASKGLPPSSSSSSPVLSADDCDSVGGVKTEGSVEGNGGAGGGGGGGAGGGTEVEADIRGMIAGISTGGGAGTEFKKNDWYFYDKIFTSCFWRFNYRSCC